MLVPEFTDAELFSMFSVDVPYVDEKGVEKTEDLWTVRERPQQRGQVVVDHEASETPEFTPNLGSVVDSKELGTLRVPRVEQLADFYQNEENQENEKSMFEA